VLILGDSRTRDDVRASQLSAALTALMNRPIRVGRIGISGGRPEIFEAVAYRVMALPVRPKAVIIGLSEWQFNASYSVDFSSDYWQLSTPLDPGYVEFSYQLTPEPRRSRLARNYLLPGLVDAHVLGEEARCLLLAPIPSGLLAKQAEWTGQTCQVATEDVNAVMDDATENAVRDIYRRADLHAYRVSKSELQHLENVVTRFRNAGIRVTFVNLPMYFIETINPDAYTMFNTAITEFSNALGIPFIDLHEEMRSDRADWRDPSHLNRDGALKWTPHFAEVLVKAGAVSPP
jgi:3-dehydroquinate dehydratase